MAQKENTSWYFKMCDFVEIWELRNKLILDGLYPMDEGEPTDGLALEKKITRLAREHYGWEEPKPRELSDVPVGASDLVDMTPLERIEDAVDILQDWGGHRTVRGLGSLIDEVRERLAFSHFTVQSYVDDAEKYWRNRTLKKHFKSRKFKQNIKAIQQGEYYVDTLIPLKYCEDYKKKIESYDLEFKTGYIHRKEGLIDVRYWRKT